MPTIWKFTLQPTDSQVIDMPAGAKVLTAAVQGYDVCLWAEVNPESPSRPRRFRMFGTGHPMPSEPGLYVGTAILSGGSLVLHVYEQPS